VTVKDELRILVERLPDEEAVEALDYLRRLVEESETLSDDEMTAVHRGQDEIVRGEYTTLPDLRRQFDG
jgi:hypothetical protein